MMFGFFGKWLPLYIVGGLAMASKGLLSDIFAGQLYSVLTMMDYNLQQFKMKFLQISMLLIVLVVITGGGSVLYFWTTAKADYNLRLALTESIMRMPIYEWTKRHSADWLCIIGRDADDASAIYKGQSQKFFGVFLSIVGGLTIVVNTNIYMAVFAVLMGFFYLEIGITRAKLRKKHEKIFRSASVELTQQISDFINSSQEARFYAIQKLLCKKQEEKRKMVYQYSKKIANIRSIDSGLSALGYTICYSGGLLFGLFLVYIERVDLSSMLALWPLSVGISFGITKVGFLLADFQSTVIAIDRVRTVLNLPKEEGGKLDSSFVLEGTAVKLEHVMFSYVKTLVLDDINLNIEKGSIIAIVGASGSGKSTLMKMLMRFYVPDSGCIEVLGMKVEDYSLKGLRRQIAYVPQNAGLYSGTIESNLKMAVPDATIEEMEKALRFAGAEEMISSFPQGLKTEVGENGDKLSGGQRQRIAVARAFLRNAPIMIFDEATAALDGKNENIIIEALKHMASDKTIIMVTHRLSTALHAKKIVVMEAGKIVEIGSHEELLEKKGVYSRLWFAQ